MSKRKKQKRRYWQSKVLTLCVSLLLAGVIVIGSTYAWVTFADNRVNHMTSGRVEIALEGDHSPVQLTPSKKVSLKNLQVRNESSMPAIVRVSLKEVLLTFELDTTDQTGNGHLKERATASDQLITLENSATWQTGATLEKSEEEQVTYLIGQLRTDYDWTLEAERAERLKQSISVKMPHVVMPTDPIPTGSYWLYYEGYFYYSEMIEPGERSELLVSSVQLAPHAQNTIKGSLYELSGVAEGYSATLSSVVNGFGLSQSSPVYQRFQGKLY